MRTSQHSLLFGLVWTSLPDALKLETLARAGDAVEDECSV